MAINQITRSDVTSFRKYASGPNTLDQYQTMSSQSAIYPGQGTPLGLDYVALKMNGEAGEFAEHVGKAMRDDALIETEPHGDFVAVYFGELTPERRTALIKEVGDVLWYLGAACRELGITLSEAAAINLEKLADRTERDVLRGSGDER
jgi:NTP pyrophosphatase (non-canonical NTP hydrolase)